MTPDTVMDLAHRALFVATLISAPLLIVSLVAGLLIGILQAATQIHEATLSFVPKLLCMLATLFIVGPWMLRVLISFTRGLIAGIPAALG